MPSQIPVTEVTFHVPVHVADAYFPTAPVATSHAVLGDGSLVMTFASGAWARTGVTSRSSGDVTPEGHLGFSEVDVYAPNGDPLVSASGGGNSFDPSSGTITHVIGLPPLSSPATDGDDIYTIQPELIYKTYAPTYAQSFRVLDGGAGVDRLDLSAHLWGTLAVGGDGNWVAFTNVDNADTAAPHELPRLGVTNMELVRFAGTDWMSLQDYVATAPKPVVEGTDLADTLSVVGGTQTYGRGGDDLLTYEQGPAISYGNLGNDTLNGGGSADTLYGGQGDDVASGSSDADRIYGNLGNDVVYGNTATDELYGDGGADTLYGGKNDDILVGGDGDDVLFGNMGADTLTGGTGADVFDLWGGGDDVVTDFDAAVDRLSASVYESVQITVSDSGAGVAVSWTATAAPGGTVLLAGVSAAALPQDLLVS